MAEEYSRTPFLDLNGMGNMPARIEVVGDCFSIGRGLDNSLVIPNPLVSRHHVEILRASDGTYQIQDKGSKAGTFVNGNSIKQHVLRHGDAIVLGDRIVGFLIFHCPPEKEGDTLSDTLGNAVELVMTDQQTRFLNPDLIRLPQYVNSRTLQRLTSLYEITHKILPAQTITELGTHWLEALFAALPVEQAGLLMYNRATRELDLVLSRNKDSEPPIALSRTIVDHCFTENVGILSRDAASDERFNGRESIIIQHISSVLCAPVSSKQHIWGVCYLASRTAAQFDGEDLEFLMATAREAGLVIENLQLIAELRATQEQLIKSERLASIGKLASSISHELRNRLALLTGIEFIQMKYAHDPEVLQFSEMVLMGQQRALALVEEIRAFAKNRPIAFEKARNSIVPVIEQTISLIRLGTDAKRRSIVFEASSAPVLVFNAEKIEQVLINLVRNAIEATLDDIGVIRVSLETEENDVVIHVADNGSGIAPEYMDRIWEPFFTTKGEEGSGIGLEICRRIVEAHQGKISCRSGIGEGTRFTIRLPLASPAASPET